MEKWTSPFEGLGRTATSERIASGRMKRHRHRSGTRVPVLPSPASRHVVAATKFPVRQTNKKEISLFLSFSLLLLLVLEEKKKEEEDEEKVVVGFDFLDCQARKEWGAAYWAIPRPPNIGRKTARESWPGHQTINYSTVTKIHKTRTRDRSIHPAFFSHDLS